MEYADIRCKLENIILGQSSGPASAFASSLFSYVRRMQATSASDSKRLLMEIRSLLITKAALDRLLWSATWRDQDQPPVFESEWNARMVDGWLEPDRQHTDATFKSDLDERLAMSVEGLKAMLRLDTDALGISPPPELKIGNKIKFALMD